MNPFKILRDIYEIVLAIRKMLEERTVNIESHKKNKPITTDALEIGVAPDNKVFLRFRGSELQSQVVGVTLLSAQDARDLARDILSAANKADNQLSSQKRDVRLLH